MYDVLSLLEGRNDGLNSTGIMYRANLSHDMLKKYLAEALTFGFATTKGHRWFLVEKGNIFLYKMRGIAELFAMPKEQEAGAQPIAIIR